MATTDKVSNSAAAAAEARERAIEEARARAEAEAKQRAAEEAARAKAAAAARAQQAAKAKPPTKTFKTDDLSTGKGGALRRNAANKLSAQGLDPANPANNTGATLKAKDLQNAKPSTSADPKQDAADLAKIQDPAKRAQQFQKLVTDNKNNTWYQQSLITNSKATLQDLTSKAVNKDSGVSTQARQATVDALAKASENLTPTAQKALADTAAGAMKDQNVGDDDDEFGTLMKNAVKDGSGASFGVRLASSLQSSGKTTAANDLSKFVGQGISDVRDQFEEDSKKVDDLHQKLGQELGAWKLEGKDQTAALKAFNQNNHLDDATKKLEQDGALLASTLNGASIARTDPALQAGADAKNAMATRFGSYSTPKYSNEGDLQSAASGALQDIPSLANTKAGSDAIAQAVSDSGKGKTTFLQTAMTDVKDAAKAGAFAGKLRNAVAQSVGAKVLASAQNGTFEQDGKDLLAGLNKNSKLFGISEDEMKGFTSELGKIQPGMAADELDTATQRVASKISAFGTTSPAAQALKGLGVVFGAVGAIKSWESFGSQDLQQKLATVSQTLNVGQQGANLITSTFSRFAADSSSAAGADTAAVEAAGLGASKLLGAGLGALGSVVSGWQAFDAFKDGHTVQGIGDTMSAVGGAVATAGLFLDGSIAGAPAGVVLNVVGGVLAGAGAIVSLFGGDSNPFSSQEGDLDKELQALGVKQDVADQLKDFNSDGQNFGTWVSTVAGQMKMSTGDFVRSMNNWSSQQVTDFLDAARLQHDTDSNNDHRLENASAVLGSGNAKALEDPSAAPYYGRYGYITPDAQKKMDAQKAAQAAMRERVDEKTGQITYNQNLVDATVAWLQAGRPAKS